MSESSPVPPRASVEQLRKRAKELLRAARQNDESASARFAAAGIRRLNADSRETFKLSDAQAVVARELGFASWMRLIESLGVDRIADRPLIRPIELRAGQPYYLKDGRRVTTDDVFETFVAARAGDVRAMRALIARAPGLATVEYNYTPPIHFAVREGHCSIVELLIVRGADLAYTSYPYGESLLTIADDREHHEVGALLRERLASRFGSRVETIGDTPMHAAAKRGDVGDVRRLIAAGAEVDVVRGDGYRPLTLAISSHWDVDRPAPAAVEIARALLAAGARYSTFVAASFGDDDFVRRAVLRDRAEANAADSRGERPITAAARRNDIALTQFLLEHGADPNAPEDGALCGHALWIAVHFRRREMARLLAEHGADPNAMVESSGTPMMRAKGDDELVALMRDHGGVEGSLPKHALERAIGDRAFADIERIIGNHPELVRDQSIWWNEGILAAPANSGDIEMLDFLIRLGARVPTVTKWGPAYYFKHETAGRFLLEHGMAPDHMNWHRHTLLHHAAAKGHTGKARLLIEHGASIDLVDDEYRSTALGMAARGGHAEIVSLLLQAGSDPVAAGAEWAVPVVWARKRGHSEIAAQLVEATEP